MSYLPLSGESRGSLIWQAEFDWNAGASKKSLGAI